MPNQKQTWALLSATATAEAPAPAPFPNTYSLDFSIDDYLDTNYIPPTALYSSGFSLSAWINPSSTTDETIIGQYSGGNRFYWRLYGSFYWVGFGSWNDWTTINSSVITGVWQSVILTYNPSDTTIRIYLDGILDDSMVKDLSSFGVPDSSLNIGAANSTGYFSGKIDELSIFSSTLGAADIAKISAAPIDLSTALSVTPVAWYRNGDSTKALYFNSIWQIPNEVKVGNWSQYSFDFDSIDDYISLGSTLSTSGDDLTLSFWFNAVNLSSGTSAFLWGDSNNFVYYNSNEILYCKINGTLSYIFANSGGVPQLFGLDNWHNLTITKSGSTVTFYVDGVSFSDLGTGGAGGFSMDTIGSATAGAYYFLDGAMDDISIFDEVKAIGDIWDGSGAPIDLSGESNLVGYWRMGENSVFSYNSEWQVPNYKKIDNFSNLSCSFDGIDDRVQCGTTSLGITSAISVSAWVKIPTTDTGGGGTNIRVIVCEDTTAGGQRDWLLYWRGTGYNYFVGSIFHTDLSASSAISTGITPNDGNWHHLLLTFDGTTDANGLKLYVDGTLFQATAGSTGINTYSSTEPTIGSITGTSSWAFLGNIDDVSIFDAVKVVADVSDGTKPIDCSADSDLVGYWLMGEGATFIDLPAPLPDSWSIPDDSTNSNNGTTSGMGADAVVNQAPDNMEQGLSSGMDIAARVNNAPDNTIQANSVNMEEADRVEDTP